MRNLGRMFSITKDNRRGKKVADCGTGGGGVFESNPSQGGSVS